MVTDDLGNHKGPGDDHAHILSDHPKEGSDPESQVGNNDLGSEKSCGFVLQNCDHNDTSNMLRDDLDTGKEKLVETVADIPETKDDVHVFAQHKENLHMDTVEKLIVTIRRISKRSRKL